MFLTMKYVSRAQLSDSEENENLPNEILSATP